MPRRAGRSIDRLRYLMFAFQIEAFSSSLFVQPKTYDHVSFGEIERELLHLRPERHSCVTSAIVDLVCADFQSLRRLRAARDIVPSQFQHYFQREANHFSRPVVFTDRAFRKNDEAK